jgi:hypothetical protein
MGVTTFYALDVNDGPGQNGGGGGGGGGGNRGMTEVSVGADGKATNGMGGRPGDTVVHVVLDGRPVPFIVSTDEDPAHKAKAFCASYDIRGDACPQQLVGKWEEEKRQQQL